MLTLKTDQIFSTMLYDVEANDLATKRIQSHISVLETAKARLTPTTPPASVSRSPNFSLAGLKLEFAKVQTCRSPNLSFAE